MVLVSLLKLSVSLPNQLRSLANLKLKLMGSQLTLPSCLLHLTHPKWLLYELVISPIWFIPWGYLRRSLYLNISLLTGKNLFVTSSFHHIETLVSEENEGNHLKDDTEEGKKAAGTNSGNLVEFFLPYRHFPEIEGYL